MRFVKLLLLILVIFVYVTLINKIISTYKESSKIGLNSRTDRFLPYFKDMTDLSQNKAELNQEQKIRFHHYYQYLIKHYPQESSINEILAFSNFYIGKKEASLQLYEISLQRNPQFFWNSYNLGLIYLSYNDLNKAKYCFETALNLNPMNSLKYIYSTKTYLQIIISTNLNPEDLTSSIKEGYEKAALYLRLINSSSDLKQIPIHPVIF